MSTLVPFSEARNGLTEIVNRVAFGSDRYVLTRNGKQVAAIVSVEDLKLLEELEDKIDFEIASRIDEDIKKNGTTKWKKAKQDLGL